MVRSAWILVLAVACGGGDGGGQDSDELVWVEGSETDKGWACLDDIDEVVRVEIDTCLSSSCTTDIEGSCTVEMGPRTITVHSTFTWREQQGGDCTDDCVEAFTTCDLPEPLFHGAYTLEYAGTSKTEHVPGDGWCGSR